VPVRAHTFFVLVGSVDHHFVALGVELEAHEEQVERYVLAVPERFLASVGLYGLAGEHSLECTTQVLEQVVSLEYHTRVL